MTETGNPVDSTHEKEMDILLTVTTHCDIAGLWLRRTFQEQRSLSSDVVVLMASARLLIIDNEQGILVNNLKVICLEGSLTSLD